MSNNNINKKKQTTNWGGPQPSRANFTPRNPVPRNPVARTRSTPPDGSNAHYAPPYPTQPQLHNMPNQFNMQRQFVPPGQPFIPYNAPQYAPQYIPQGPPYPQTNYPMYNNPVPQRNFIPSRAPPSNRSYNTKESGGFKDYQPPPKENKSLLKGFVFKDGKMVKEDEVKTNENEKKETIASDNNKEDVNNNVEEVTEKTATTTTATTTTVNINKNNATETNNKNKVENVKSNDSILLDKTVELDPPTVDEHQTISDVDDDENSNDSNVSLNEMEDTYEDDAEYSDSQYSSDEEHVILKYNKLDILKYGEHKWCHQIPSDSSFPESIKTTKSPNEWKRVHQNNRHHRKNKYNNNGRPHRRHHKHKYKQAPLTGPLIPLKKAENKYVRGLVKDENDALKKEVKLILNKLALDKFEKLSDKLIILLRERIGDDLNDANAESLNMIVKVIFDKALSEAFFAEMYADLCKKLSEKLWIQKDIDTDTTPNNKSKKSVTPFKRALLNQCQEEFMADSISIDKTDKTEAEIEFEEHKQKTRMLGNIRFIGELFKRGMIIRRIMHSCVEHLLTHTEKDIKNEEELESLCKLLTTVGSVLDKSNSNNEKSMEQRRKMDNYMNRMKSVSDRKGLPSRLKFMIMDVLDLRKDKWQLRKAKQSLKPKTISEFRASHGVKQQRQSRYKSNSSNNRLGHQDIRDLKSNNNNNNNNHTQQSALHLASRFDRYAVKNNNNTNNNNTNTYKIMKRNNANINNNNNKSAILSPPSLSINNIINNKNKYNKTEIFKKSKSFINEYINARDEKEVIECIKELESPEYTYMCITSFICAAVDGRDNTSLLIPLFQYLIKANIIQTSDISFGYAELLYKLPDIVEDCPNAAERSAILLAELMNNTMISIISMSNHLLSNRQLYQALFDSLLLEKFWPLLCNYVISKEMNNVSEILQNIQSIIQITLDNATLSYFNDYVITHKLNTIFPHTSQLLLIENMINKKDTLDNIIKYIEDNISESDCNSDVFRKNILRLILHIALDESYHFNPAIISSYVKVIKQYQPELFSAIEVAFITYISVSYTQSELFSIVITEFTKHDIIDWNKQIVEEWMKGSSTTLNEEYELKRKSLKNLKF